LTRGQTRRLSHTPAWLATSPEVEGVTGRFFVKRRAVETAPRTTDVERWAGPSVRGIVRYWMIPS
jgi:hypothetical protein